jgi:hypothetical protein
MRRAAIGTCARAISAGCRSARDCKTPRFRLSRCVGGRLARSVRIAKAPSVPPAQLAHRLMARKAKKTHNLSLPSATHFPTLRSGIGSHGRRTEAVMKRQRRLLSHASGVTRTPLSRPKSGDSSLLSRPALMVPTSRRPPCSDPTFRAASIGPVCCTRASGTEPALDAPPVPGRASPAGGVHAKLVGARPAVTVCPAGLVVVGLGPRVTGVEVTRFADPLGEFARAIEKAEPASGAIPVEGQVRGSRPK